MKIEMVDIQEESASLTTTIALLVDRRDFLEDIRLLRKQLGLNELIESASFDTILLFAKSIGDDQPENYLLKVNEAIKTIRQKYRRTVNHDPMIRWVLFTNSVPKGIFKHAYFQKVAIQNNDEPQYVIVLDPRATETEVKNALDEFRQETFGVAIKQVSKLFNQGMSDEYLPTSSINKYDFEAGLISQEDAEMAGGELSIGPLYGAADKETITKQKNLSFSRSMYWLRYGNQINDPASKPLSNQEVLDAWKQLCPKQGRHEDGKEDECIHCNIDDLGLIQEAIEQHVAILSKDF
jgi:hypothetical protein